MPSGVTKMTKILPGRRRFLRSEEGAALIYAALILPVLIGFGALAIDFGYVKMKQSAMQIAADAAAYSGAAAIAAGFNYPSYNRPILEAYSSAAYSGFTSGVTPTINSTAVTTNGFSCAAYQCVTVKIQETRNLLLLNAFRRMLPANLASVTYGASATARVEYVNDFCMLVLGQTKTHSALNLGGSASITGSGCGVAVNSTASDAITTNGSAASINAVVSNSGGYTYTGNPPKMTINYGWPVPDPYLNNTALQNALNNFPTSKASNFVCNSGNSSPAGGHYDTLSGSCTLSAGTYYFDNMSLSGNNTIAGTGVTIILGSNATATMGGSSKLNITAPGDSASVGIPGVALASKSTNQLTYKGTSTFSGAIYWPNGAVSLGGTSAACMQLIADSVDMQGTPTLDDSCIPSTNRSLRAVIQLIN
jgi:Flp pilus assembly protein TadG